MKEPTPGPWIIDKRCSTRVCLPIENNRGIASTGGYFSNDQDVAEENEANARLIAAAPDLLAACEAALEDGPHNASCGLHLEVVDVLRAAIAKAKGSQQ
jgi:hypothetical protein